MYQAVEVERKKNRIIISNITKNRDYNYHIRSSYQYYYTNFEIPLLYKRKETRFVQFLSIINNPSINVDLCTKPYIRLY